MPVNKEKITFKEKFIERYSKLTDFEEFKKYCLTYLRRSIRVNTLKIPVDDAVKRIGQDWHLIQVPWCREGFWIEHKGEGDEKRRDVGNMVEHALGYVYVQEAASMIPPIVLEPKPGEIVMDMCAAPGSKASQIAQYMENKGILVANDYKGIRIAPLGINIQRCGISNCIITLMQGRFWNRVPIEFDRILVDAPCSGTGTVRKSLKTLLIWNPVMVKRLAGAQKQLIGTAFSKLKTGGTMVYSTCSCEPEENEGVVDFLLSKYPEAKLEETNLAGLKKSEPILDFDGNSYNSEIKKCLRIWPQDNDTEGFFVAKIVKDN